ncbi:MAG: GNAT family N-acetyltransferase [Chloroflexi bacterium]|nr:GNAT family N-acetyltransferase [Chloroflexota bacterium]
MTKAAGGGKAKIVVRPVTPERWDDLVELFGPRGACAGCWCMYFRLSRAEFERRQGASNRRALHRLVSTGRVPGLIACVDGVPAGWVALAPREEYPLLSRSRILQPVDDTPVWSVVCFFTARAYRRQGVTEALLHQASGFAKRWGARWLEGYPVDPGRGSLPDTFAYHGLAAAFRRAGFREVARRSATRPIMRLELR